MDNRRQEEQETPSSENADLVPQRAVDVEPYFPAGLAKSAGEPTHFNFELFLFDTLRLPYGFFPEDEQSPVEFRTLDECQDYCTRFIEGRGEWLTQQMPHPADESQRMLQELDKVAMFHQTGTPLGERMTTGNATFDFHLADLRLDIFGNLMFLNGPSWSDISAQFMHGYPRRLITASHRGVLAGNITIASRISNQAIRSLSTGKNQHYY